MVELHANLYLRSNEPGEVLRYLEDLADGKADDVSTVEYLRTMQKENRAVARLLADVGFEEEVK
ncbi:hypothetical protein L2W58_08220 [Dethiosulfovibrio sp. F2B]|uniref:hypothetical protein n=1 Tax=Dethiosulfovibrio faecalis TaxID=2720018 RepID=UPI001F2D56C4|nr:hypothetical protein [Dethiosulfovibrio faecalis]MCF4151787.1 hypothetical protein [Dethiosulfovibrio faecalis]